MQLDLSQIKLKTNWIKRNNSIFYHQSVESTIKTAFEAYREDNNNEKKIVVADCQTDGVGSYNKKWLNIPYKDIALTVILGKSLDFEQELVDDTCQAVINTLKNWDIEGYLKKPNDIYVNNRKISGILLNKYFGNVPANAYAQLGYSGRSNIQYLSVGLNVNSNAEIRFFDENAKVQSTSFFRETGEIFPREKVLNYLIHQIDIAIQKQVHQ